MGNQSKSTRYITFLKGRVGREVATSLWISWGQRRIKRKAQNRRAVASG
ncbi:hypothetical protein ACNKHU_13430 [Shigella flexneri]